MSDARFSEALDILSTDDTPAVQDVVRVLRDTSIAWAARSDMPDPVRNGVEGGYSQITRDISINREEAAGLDAEELACLLLHEGQHALDDRNGLLCPVGRPASDDEAVRDILIHVRGESAAYQISGDYWQRRFPGGRHVTGSEFESVQNMWATISDSPEHVSHVVFLMVLDDVMNSHGEVAA